MTRIRAWRIGVLALLLVLVSAASGALLWIDTAAGHRFVEQRVAALRPASGLRIRLSGLEGGLYDRPRVREIRLLDPQGMFFVARDVQLDWWPWSWFVKRLTIDKLAMPYARMERLPRLRSTSLRGPTLPDIDVRLMRFAIDRLELGRALAGREGVVQLYGDIDLRDGRAVADVQARSPAHGDRLLLAMDSRPDDNRFDLDMTLNAPARGVFAGMAGITRDANVRVRGDGTWADWRGSLVATLDGAPAAGFSLRNRAGQFTLSGAVERAAIGTARTAPMASLIGERITVEASGQYADRILRGTMRTRMRAASVTADGGLDLRAGAFDNLTIAVNPERAIRLSAAVSGRALIAKVRLDGPMRAARAEYLVRGDEVRLGRVVLHRLRAEGKGQVGGGAGSSVLPLSLTLARVEGGGPIADRLSRDMRLSGQLVHRGSTLRAGPITVKSAGINGRMTGTYRTDKRDYAIQFDGEAPGLELNALGRVDVRARFDLRPGAGGQVALSGPVEARMRRIDNGFLRGLGGGLPIGRADIAIGGGGAVYLRAIDLRAPFISLRGTGERMAGGTYRFALNGVHRSYGPAQVELTGRLERPRVDLLLARPNDAAGLHDVRAVLVPDDGGYGVRSTGGSRLGPFTLDGRLMLARGQQAVLRVDPLMLGGARAWGDLTAGDGGLSGRLEVGGPLRGFVSLIPVDGVQQLALSLDARDARFDGPAALAVRSGTIEASARLVPGATNIVAGMRARGVQFGPVRLNHVTASARMTEGRGTVRASVSGQRGRSFALQMAANVTPDAVALTAAGTLDRRPLRLSGPARFAREGMGWRLAPVTMSYRGGTARLRGLFGPQENSGEIALSAMPLSLLDLSNSDLGLGGLASGTIGFMQPHGQVPTGSARLLVRGLTRSGVTRTSPPIDMGMNAVLGRDHLAFRAVAEQKGAPVGRAQARFALAPSGALWGRIANGAMLAQMRYAGPVEALWRLSGVEIIDLGGSVQLGAAVRGTLARPEISGALATGNATLVSPVTGMRLSAITASGKFDGDRLVIDNFAGKARGGGTVTGAGRFDLSATQGIGMDLSFETRGAEVLNRDDIAASVSGPLSIRSDGNGGVIAGTLDIVRSRFSMGRAAAIAQIPEMRVIERNGRAADFDSAVPVRPWSLNIKARAKDRLMVDGLGLNSEWRTTLDIGGPVTAPVLVGRAEMIRGSYDFAGRRFDMSSGTLRFTGVSPANPDLDITAQASVSDLSATIRITGTSQSPVVGFSSTPALPEEEVLSRILFGSSITQLSAPEAVQLGSAIASLQGQGDGLDPINAVRKVAGLDRLRILPADTTTGQSTSVAVGKYLTRRSYVELVTDGQGYSATRIEYQVTRWLSLLASVSTIGRQSATARVSRDY